MPDMSELSDKAREADLTRARALAEIRRISDHGASPLPWLLRRVNEKPALLRLHVWMVEQAAFGTGRTLAVRHVQRAAQWCDETLDNPATATLSWLLDARTRGTRWSAWLLALALDMGFTLRGPDPFTTASSPPTSPV